MAGHSQFKNIMHRKGAQDAKRAKRFTKIIRELTVAASLGGEDPENNPRLRTAILSARSSNMPKETMERAIKRGSGDAEGANYSEVRYEGYGPGGVALIVEGLTDNKNRTAAEVRTIFNKSGGSLGESGSVSFSFEHKGVFVYDTALSEEALLEAALEAGADSFEKTEAGLEITCQKEKFSQVRDKLQRAFGEPLHVGLAWISHTPLELQGEASQKVQKLLDTLEDNDDVQEVWTNAALEN